jgi:hypothetical protein
MLSKAKLGAMAKLSTEAIRGSLTPGNEHALKVRPDGTILDGHHRIKILRDRGIEVDALPREIISRREQG